MGRFVSLAGNIGVGKTTAARLIADAFDFRILLEPVLTNRFLADYYGDMKRWSFTLQMEFLLRRIEHHKQVDLGGGNYVQDRTLLEDPEVFAKYLHGLGNMSDSELDLYFDYCRMLMPTIRQPDAILMLGCSDTNVILRRISERGRAEEKGISINFLKGLSSYYATLAAVCENKYEIPVLEVDVAAIDIRTAAGKKAFLDTVEAFIFHGDSPTELLF